MCDLFGSDDTPSIITQVQQSNLPPWLNTAAEGLVTRASEVSARPYQGYTGPRVAPLSAGQNAALSTAAGSTNIGMSNIGNAGGYNARSALTMPETDMSQYINPYLGGVLTPTLRELSEASDRERNDIRARSVATGAFGGARGRIGEQEALEKYYQSVGDVTGRTYADAWNTGLSALEADRAALSRAAETEARLGAISSGLANESMDRNLTAGALERGLDQANYDTAYGDFLEQRDWDERQLDTLIRAISGTPYPRETTSTQTVPQQGGNSVGQVAGLGLAAGGLLAKYI